MWQIIAGALVIWESNLHLNNDGEIALILIDFSKASKEAKELFEDISDLDYVLLRLQLIYKTDLHERDSVIIFNEVQLCPKTRQAIKHLVKDYRYDYIETGSLIISEK